MKRVAKPIAGLLIVLAVVLPAAPALAHTSLAESTPANLSRLDGPPESITLVFTDPVEPETVSIDVQDVEGREHAGHQRRPAGADTASEVTFELPDLPDGTYGITWQSIGSDGHRAAGEVVLGIGNVDGEQLSAAQFRTLSPGDRWVEIAGAAGRFAWYLGLSFAVGSLFALWWLGSRTQWNTSERSFWKLSRRWLVFGQQMALAGFAILSASRIAVRGAALEGNPGVAARLEYGLASLSGLALLAVVVCIGWGLKASKGISVRPYASPRAERWRRIASALVLAGLGASLGGHLAARLPLEIATLVRGAHLLAAALWIGPLAIAAVWWAARHNQAAGADGESWALMKGFFGRFSRVAGWTLIVLVATGIETLWVNVGTDLFANRYGWVLTVKVLLLAAGIIPLAWYHRRTVAKPDGPINSRFQRSLKLELSGLTAVLVLASTLTVLNPTAGPIAEPGGDPGDLLSSEPVTDVEECDDLGVGQANCYTQYFSALMKEQDAGVAVAKIHEVAQSSSYVASQCHQMTHDLGREAADHYDSLGEALSFEASACWSGYYHGVVEEKLARYDDERLKQALPAVCSEPAAERYSFNHYNCVHGVGHGIMLRFDSDLFESLPYCRAYTDAWELSSCAGGAFMQNIISAQEGADASFREGDLVYPCNAVDDDLIDECFTMQTSYVLWRNGQNLQAAFEVCDSVDERFAPDCYQSMGRDISGNAMLDPPTVVEGCNLGREDRREHCIIGAALNAVYNDHDPAKATELCNLVEARYQQACLDARDRAVSTF
ncbi:MAG: copper resistance protein CopC [Actinomycetota bacterium]